jgi:hypothetical protein
LTEVKDRLPHGAWLPWLKTEFGWTDRTAENFMNVSQRFKSETVSNSHIDMGALYRLASPKTPEAARTEAIRRAESGERITRSVVEEIITTGRTAAAGRSRPTPVDRKRVWACRAPQKFRDELLRLVRSYEKANPPITTLSIVHRNGVAVEVQIIKEGQQ